MVPGGWISIPYLIRHPDRSGPIPLLISAAAYLSRLGG
jgi:hypothetical protein